MNFRLTPEIKRQIFDTIIETGNFYGRYADGRSREDLNIVDFLKLIWDLPTMPSEDTRFRNAEADAFQHLINNDDWDVTYVFETRFNLLAGNENYFIKFLEVVVLPEVREDRQDIEKYVSLINPHLRVANCELAIQDFIDNMPIYKVMDGVGRKSMPRDILPNNIPIIVDEKPVEYPAFELDEYTWDDYGNKTRYRLYYYDENGTCHGIGIVKIMMKDESKTYGMLQSSFTALPENCCSLGQTISYYTILKNLLGENYRNFLYAFRDAACFSQICDEFSDSNIFKNSLLRTSDADNALLLAQYTLAGYNINDGNDFVFKAKLPYNEEELNIKFQFGNAYNEDNLNRIIALIGNNGVGKTTVLSQLAECIASGASDRFLPHRPIFSKVLSASYSIFDKFFNIEGTSFNYKYCGIRNKDGGLMSDEEIARRRKDSVNLINKHNRKSMLYGLLSRLFQKALVDELFDDGYMFLDDKFQEIADRCSSGQSMLMNLVIEILANIRNNTLLLIDEPEVHLHPKGISEIVKIIDLICQKYSSCCIMATHSPVIVQELLSRNIIVLDREIDGSPVVRSMRIESMGENLTTITDDIFGRYVKEPLYMKKLKQIADRHDSIDSALQEIQNSDVPVSMKLYLTLDKYING